MNSTVNFIGQKANAMRWKVDVLIRHVSATSTFFPTDKIDSGVDYWEK